MCDNHRLVEDLFTNKENIKFHMFSARVENRIMTKSNSALIVTEDYWSRKSDFEFMKKGLDPQDFIGSKGKAAILSFNTRPDNESLRFRPPRNKIGTKKDTGP